jgi:hypothetical protein
MTDDTYHRSVRTDPELEPDPAPGADPQRRELRAELGKYAPLAGFPTTAGALVDAARSAGAPETVLAALLTLAPETRLETVGDLWTGLRLEPTARY